MTGVALDRPRLGLDALLAQLGSLAAARGFRVGGLLLGDFFLSGGLHVWRQFERPLAAAAGKRAGEQRRDC
jgi:hypothetical protein